MTAFGDGHPMTLGDVLGPEFEARDLPYRDSPTYPRITQLDEPF
jgi:hypothetical protein